MNASNNLESTENSNQSLSLAGDIDASAGFSSLDKSRQVLIFQTIQEAISAVPPRLEATFPRVVAAFTTLTKVVEAAAQGLLDENILRQLESDVDAAGGVIAPGLWSQGDNSISVFRAATFEQLRNNFQPPVVDAALEALNARLRALRLNDLGRVFQVIATFFSPLTSTTGNAANLQALKDLDVDRQVLVFRTIQQATLANPPRTEANFPSVVAAFQAEVKLLNSAACGKLTEELFETFEINIEAAGGVLAPGTYAKGQQSISAFRAETFKSLQQLLPAEVMASAFSALNARLREIRPNSLQALFKGVHSFFMPLLAQGWTSPTLQSFKALDPHYQALVFRTVETAINSNPDLEGTIFSSAVKAICAELITIKAASIGKLTIPVLVDLQSSISLCGGFVEPGLSSDGEGSVGEFIGTYFMALKRDKPAEVSEAAIAALNAKLRTASISNFQDVIQETKNFMEPLITVLQLNPHRSASSTTEILPPAEPMAIEATRLIPPLAIEKPSEQSAINTNETEEPTDLDDSIRSPLDEDTGHEDISQSAYVLEESIASEEAREPCLEQPNNEELASSSVRELNIVPPLQREVTSAAVHEIPNEAPAQVNLKGAATSSPTEFPISWVLVKELAVGPAPVETRHLDHLETEGIRGILSLCSTQERPEPDGLDLRFRCQRVVLPDPRSQGHPSLEQLEQALNALAELRTHGAVYVHCVAAVERSPLVCMAWLMQQHGVSRQHALDYMLQVHPGTSPSSELLAILNELPQSAKTD